MGRFTPYSLSKYRFIHTFRVFIQCLGRIYSHSEWIFSQSPWKICFMLYCWFTDKLCLIIFLEVCQFKIFSCTNVRSHNIHSGRRNEVNRDHASAHKGGGILYKIEPDFVHSYVFAFQHCRSIPKIKNKTYLLLQYSHDCYCICSSSL